MATSNGGAVTDDVDQEAPEVPKEEAGIASAPKDSALNTGAGGQSEESPAKGNTDDINEEDDVGLDETELESPLPEDIFSLIYVTEPHGISFFYSLSVYIIQMTLIVLIFFDLLDLDSDTNVLKVPPGVNLEVTIAQGISMALAVATQNNLLTAISRLAMRSSYDHEYVASNITPLATLHDYTLGVIMQLISGMVMLVDNFILNMQVGPLSGQFKSRHDNTFTQRPNTSFIVTKKSNTVLSLLLNFAALSFVSEIQTVAFWLARNGFVHKHVRDDCLVVINFRIPRQHRKHTSTWTKRALFGSIIVALLGGCVKIAVDQRSGKYLCKKLLVQFGDGFRPDLPFFTGVYEQTGDLIDDRVIYKNEKTGAFFAYCQKKKAWTFAGPTIRGGIDLKNGTISTIIGNDDPCDYWAISQETETYDITETFKNWRVFDYFSNQTLPIDHFMLVCLDCEGRRATQSCSGHGQCVDNECVCESHRVGIACEYPFPCTKLALDERTRPFPYVPGGYHLPATNYDLLLDNSSRPVMVYSQPVYVARVPNTELALNVILFTGRRWGLFLNLEFDDASLDEQQRPGLPSYLPGDFHSWFSKYRLYFFSNPMDYGSPSDNGNPAEHLWFKSRRWLSIGDRSLYRVDTNQPLSTVLLCPECVPFLNDCMNGGTRKKNWCIFSLMH